MLKNWFSHYLEKISMLDQFTKEKMIFFKDLLSQRVWNENILRNTPSYAILVAWFGGRSFKMFEHFYHRLINSPCKTKVSEEFVGCN
jgi:hypothetical protein